jgi:hypothetical protein
VFIIGAIPNVFVNKPVFQEYVVAPLAVNEAVWPAHMVAEFTVTFGNGLTDTFAIAVFVQPKAVPVTV